MEKGEVEVMEEKDHLEGEGEEDLLEGEGHLGAEECNSDLTTQNTYFLFLIFVMFYRKNT